MRRAVLTLGGTVAGLAALLSFKSHPAAVTAETAPAAPTATQSAAPAQSAPAKKSATGKGSATGKKSAGSGATTATHTVTGAAENTPYGPMQVALTMTGKKITSVQVVQQTNDGAESQQIDGMAIPKLKTETLAAQSARIDAVSGATYTSQGYIQSLQSALDKPM